MLVGCTVCTYTTYECNVCLSDNLYCTVDNAHDFAQTVYFKLLLILYLLGNGTMYIVCMKCE